MKVIIFTQNLIIKEMITKFTSLGENYSLKQHLKFYL